jgi:uncharacterized protein (TIGR02145 family)
MKRLILIFILLNSLFSCKKVSDNSTVNPTSKNDSIVCLDNPNINFKSIGTPIGKFKDCIKDIDGNTYKTVLIGNQTWMAENLKTSKYNDGTNIPNVTDSIQWSKLSKGAWVYYNNDVANNSKYGKLYNWYSLNPTSNGNKNICPAGWHVPSFKEWTVLVNNLGGSTEVEGGLIIAFDKLKEVSKDSWFGSYRETTNTSLFTALPGGQRGLFSNDFKDIGFCGFWWISSVNSFFLNLGENKEIDEGFWNNGDCKSCGFSIRCLKD